MHTDAEGKSHLVNSVLLKDSLLNDESIWPQTAGPQALTSAPAVSPFPVCV